MDDNNKWLDKENILSRVDQRTLYQYYFRQKIDLRRNKYLNPFRPDNQVGSCHFNWFKGRFYFFDKSTGECIDVFSYIRRIYNCSFYEALYKINIDFELNFNYNPQLVRAQFKPSIRKGIPSTSGKMINSRRVYFNLDYRGWNQDDADYWTPFGISSSLLDKYNVRPVSVYSSNYSGLTWKKTYDYEQDNDPCYAYKCYVDKELQIKIYRPLAKKKDKWRSSCRSDTLFGYEQLTWNKEHSDRDVTFICSSLKDGMCLTKLGYQFICPLSESSYIDADKIRELKARFGKLVILFDKDQSGVSFSIKFGNVYDIDYITLPENRLEYTDVAELCKQTSYNYLKYTIDRQLND